ncbi:hypothetical protein HDV00_012509 [Rhizophlyctis rosea]|nr:hypothetical protein HDV00_012509 [Rhizophlyctis rosea]
MIIAAVFGGIIAFSAAGAAVYFYKTPAPSHHVPVGEHRPDDTLHPYRMDDNTADAGPRKKGCWSWGRKKQVYPTPTTPAERERRREFEALAERMREGRGGGGGSESSDAGVGDVEQGGDRGVGDGSDVGGFSRVSFESVRRSFDGVVGRVWSLGGYRGGLGEVAKEGKGKAKEAGGGEGSGNVMDGSKAVPIATIGTTAAAEAGPIMVVRSFDHLEEVEHRATPDVDSSAAAGTEDMHLLWKARASMESGRSDDEMEGGMVDVETQRLHIRDDVEHEPGLACY